jgi:hypothetical protein
MEPLPGQPVCPQCGDVIGVYEPIMVAVPGEPVRRTSWLAEGQMRVRDAAWHERCFAKRARARADA